MANRSYDAETKAQVMAALLEGQSVSSVATRYEIPKGTVSNWKRTELRGVREKQTQKGLEDIGDLLMQLLRANIRGLIAAAEVTGEKDWIREQGAAELATLFGVKHDKVVRLIESLNAPSDAEA